MIDAIASPRYSGTCFLDLCARGQSAHKHGGQRNAVLARGRRLSAWLLFYAALPCAAWAQDATSASGTNAAPGVAAIVSPPALSFRQSPGRTSRNQMVTVTNNGNVPITLGKVDIVGPQAKHFVREISSTCVSNLTITPGMSCDFAVNFTPSETGMHDAQLVIPHSDSPRPTVVKLSGVAPEPAKTAGDNSSAMLEPAAAKPN